MGIIWIFFFTILRIFRIPYRISCLFSSFLLFLYTTVIPLRPSVLRANIMIFIFSLMIFLEKETLSLNTLGMAGFISLIVNPHWLFDHGFLLSYLATGGIFFFYPGLFRIIKTKFDTLNRYFISPFTISLSAQLFVSPYLLYNFKYLSLISVLSNLLLTPFLTLTLTSSFLLLLLSPFPVEFLKSGIKGFTLLSKDMLFYLNNLLSSFKFSCIYVRNVSPLIFLSYFLFLLIGTLLNSKAREV